MPVEILVPGFRKPCGSSPETSGTPPRAGASPTAIWTSARELMEL
jgi:hypothetical protein